MSDIPNAAPMSHVAPAAVREALAADDSRLGDVYRLTAEGLSAQEIAARVGIQATAWVYRKRHQIAALLDRQIPGSPRLARSTASRIRTWLSHADWDPESRSYLEALQVDLMAVSTDTKLVEREDEDAARSTHAAEARNIPGVYVYSLPHYLRYPFDALTGHTLLKVGHSAVDVFSRVGGQSRTTALPEDPVLLRIYATTDNQSSREEEQHFHDWLEAADHSRSRASKGGREWFLTSTKFLDRIAAQRGLPIEVVSSLDGDTDLD